MRKGGHRGPPLQKCWGPERFRPTDPDNPDNERIEEHG